MSKIPRAECHAFLGGWNDGGFLEAHEDHSMLKGEVETVGEDCNGSPNMLHLRRMLLRRWRQIREGLLG